MADKKKKGSLAKALEFIKEQAIDIAKGTVTETTKAAKAVKRGTVSIGNRITPQLAEGKSLAKETIDIVRKKKRGSVGIGNRSSK